MVFHLIGGGKHLQRIFRMLTKRGADENGSDVGAHRKQIVNQLRYAFVIETRQRFQNIQPGRFPEVIHFSGFAMLYRQPAIARQTLEHFSQRGTGDANQFREFAFSR